jgi:CheY-like chemotaxis protein
MRPIAQIAKFRRIKRGSGADTAMKFWTLKDLNILVVDDFPDMRSSVRSMLAPLGANKITEARNGEDAVEAMKRQTMDLVLCDYNLGSGKDGQQVLEEARALQLLPYASIFILVTAEDTSNMVMGAIEYVPDDYLVKPFTRSILQLRIKKIQESKSQLEDISKALAAKNHDHAIQLCDSKLQEPGVNRSELLKLKGSLLMQRGDFEAAKQLFTQALDQREQAWARLGLGRCLHALKEYPVGKQVLEELIEQNPKCVEAYDCLAKVHKAMGDSAASQQVLAAATRISPKVITRQRALAEIAYENHDLTTAESAFKTVVKEGKHSFHRSPSDFGGLARVYLDKGAPQDAIKAVGDMAKEFKGNDNAVQAKAAAVEVMVYQKTGLKAESVQALDKVMGLYQQDPGVLPAGTALDLVEASYALGNAAAGDELLKHVVRNSHENESTLAKVKDICAKTGNTSLLSLIEDTRREVITTNNQGVNLAKQGKFNEAIGLFLNAARSMPENITVNLNVAMSFIAAMQKNGPDERMRQQAEQYLAKAREIDPDNARLREMQKMLRQATGSMAA